MSDTYRELFLDKQDQLLNALQKAIKLQEELNEIEKFHPRAVKLIRKKRNFVAISEYEPYFMQAYELIREHELKKGTWSDDDQQAFETAKNHRLPCGHHYHALVHPLLGTPYCDECLKIQNAAEHSCRRTSAHIATPSQRTPTSKRIPIFVQSAALAANANRWNDIRKVS